MKGISILLIVTLVVSAYGDSLENSEWEALEKLRQENAARKEKVLSFLRELGKEQQTENEKYNPGLIHSKNREIENDDKNIENWRPGSPSILVSLTREFKQNNGDDTSKEDQNKNQKKDDSDDTDNEDSNVEDVNGENSNQNEKESSIKNRHRRNDSRKDSSDESNSNDDGSSDEELRRHHRGEDKPKKKNSDESNSDDRSKDSDEKNSKDSRKDKRKKQNSDESNSDDRSDDSDSDETNSRDSRKDKRKKKNSDESDSDCNDSDNDKKNSKERKSKEKSSDESNCDSKSDDSDGNKSKKDKCDESKNSSEEKKWRWILGRGNHRGNRISEPWNWKPETNWELEAKRAELKGRLIAIVKIEKVIKLLKNRTDEFNKRGHPERTLGLIRAIEAHKKLLGENIIAVSRICNITEVQPNELFETIIKCAANYSLRWRKLSNVGGPILENKEAILKPLLQEFSAAPLNLSKTDTITHILNEKGLADKAIVTEGEQVNGVVSWQSQPDKSASPSESTGAISEVVSLNSRNSSGNKQNGSGANVDDSAASDKDQAPEPVPTNGKEDNEGNNLNDQPGSDSQVQTPKHIKIESSSAGDNGVNPSNNENEIPGSNDDQPGNDDSRSQQSVPKSDESVVGSRNRSTENLDLKPEVSSGSDNTGKVVATPDNNSSSKSNKLANDINKLEDLNSDQIKVSIKSTELLATQAENSALRSGTDKGQNNDNSDREVGDSSADSNNQIPITTDNQTSSGNNVVTDGTSSQTDSTTSQPEQTSEISENTDTKEPRSTSELSTEETTDTVQNASSESESIFNTAAPESTSLIDE
ncbi:uncharacterized protein LOC143353705 [Halictus rubicundus]|uniref:uncharacterized protein LOC143353705 n=1 Tax=Halictus rubicundus TaxID=77578 RepID=UPI004036F243